MDSFASFWINTHRARNLSSYLDRYDNGMICSGS